MEGVVTPVNIIAFIVVLVIAAAAAYVYKNGVPVSAAGPVAAGPDGEDAEVGRHCQKKVLKMFKSFGCELSKDGKTLKSDNPIPHGLGKKFTLADATRAVIDMAVNQQMNASVAASPRAARSGSGGAAAQYTQGPPPGLGIPEAPVGDHGPPAESYDDSGGIGVGGALPAGFQMSEEEMAKYASQPN